MLNLKMFYKLEAWSHLCFGAHVSESNTSEL